MIVANFRFWYFWFWRYSHCGNARHWQFKGL